MIRTVLGLGLVLSLSGDVAGRAEPVADPAPCVTSRAEARVRYPGYDHVVILTNACDPTFRCSVTTDVSPDTVVVDVPGRREVEIVTYRGSPTSQFRHKADCQKKE